MEEKDQAAGLGKEGDLGFSKLTITEKDDAGGGDVSLDEWIGPSNAIEGYVPQYDSKKGEFPPPLVRFFVTIRV